jgi:hypothetical protein
MIAVVIKQFDCDGVSMKPGTLVETEGWRNEAGMLRARHIRPASSSEAAKFKTKTKGEKGA